MNSRAPVPSWWARLHDTVQSRLAWLPHVRRSVATVDAGSAARLATTRAALRDFGQASDGEFTALARGLGRVNPRLAEVRERSNALDRLLRDQDEERPIASAYALYKNSVDLVHANAGIAVSAQGQLSTIERALASACGTREAFRRDHLFLRIVTLGIRIEASRLPPDAQAVFLNVAAAIGETGERIGTCTEAAFDQLQAIIASSVAARADLAASEASLHREARQSIETIQHELQVLQQAIAPASAHSARIAAQFAAAQPQALAIISALQHQDIVRQQLEHVAEGFGDLEAHLEPAAAGAAPIEWDYVLHAARIQQAQLAGARTEIEKAGRTVTDGLGTLLATIETMVAEFGAMETAAAGALDRCRIVELFEHEITQLSAIVERSRKSNERTTVLVDQISGVVRLFSEEISRYELDVKIVALNAQIAAARLESADALNKLAEQTSRLADTNAQMTRQLSGTLHESLDQLERVKREGADFVAIVTRERGELQANVGSVSRKLARLVGRVRTGSSEVRQCFAPVQADCTALLRELRFPELIGTTFAPAVALCTELEHLAAARARGGVSADAAARIERHQQRYTMRKEEATHSAALRAPPRATPGPTGDIELFTAAPAVPPSRAHETRAPERAPAVPPATEVGDIELFSAPPSDEPPSTAPRPALNGGPAHDSHRRPAVPDAPANELKPASPTPPAPSANGEFGDGIELF
jgi:hypothetical protein